ncbi:MAG TPA: ParB N-terminal domain-containing protein [Micromonosporaceae bacterium]|nr:ParB N-terminal domain-containing protein [Micromonosporaceae bacterium]
MSLALAVREELGRLGFEPGQPRDDRGRWTDGVSVDVPAADVMSWEQVETTYGEQVDEREPEDGLHISAHSSGDLVVYTDAAEDRYEINVDMGAGEARTLADLVESLAGDAEGYDPDDPDATPPSDNGLVDWVVSDGWLVGYDAAGDVMVRRAEESDPTETREDIAALDVGVDTHSPYELADALRDMADVADEAAEPGQPAAVLCRAVRAVLRGLRFDPAQPRDPHTGEWVDAGWRLRPSTGSPPASRSSSRKATTSSTVAPALRRAVRVTLRTLGFDPDQPRDDHGRWSDGVPHPPDPRRDKLSLAGRIPLDPGEELLSSGKLDLRGDGAIRVAVTRRDGRSLVRLGIAPYGAEELPRWTGGPPRTAQLDAERERIRAERTGLDEESDRYQQLSERLAELGEDDDWPTARLDGESIRTTLRDAISAAEPAEKDIKAWLAELNGLQAELDSLRWATRGRELTPEEDARWDALAGQIKASEDEGPGLGSFEIAAGEVPGEWGDLAYDVYVDEPDSGVQVALSVRPAGMDRDTWTDTTALTLPELRKLVRLLPGDEAALHRAVRRALRALGFDPDQPRDPHTGKWVTGVVNPLDLPVALLDAAEVEPWNDVEDEGKLASLAESMRDGGWRGPPVVVIPAQDYGWGAGSPQAITGSHRIHAAREVGVQVPTVSLDDLLSRHGTSLAEVDEQTGADPDDERHTESVVRLGILLPEDVIEQYGLDTH